MYKSFSTFVRLQAHYPVASE